ncbi:hypothetical protein [Streptomyces violaceus]|uniref:Uncharacterized protein n=1 Tax=Streptomyces violaceus TaxID=1936 RepID=A0ABY9UB16_STRVL|nr:hypothetical protein [Streptomyces janthinus]WND20068.1 hypothetical protein RI060_23205 [Streptomyces janthinus]
MTAVYAKDFDLFFSDIYRPFRKKSNKEFRDYVRKYLSSSRITVAVHTQLTQMYERILSDLEPAAARYQTDFPGVYRVTRTATKVLGKIPRAYKELVRDEEVWEEVLAEMQRGSQEIDNVDRLRSEFSTRLIKELGQDVENTYRGCLDIMEVLTIVIDAHMAAPDRRLMKESKHERGMKMKPFGESSVSAELYEDLWALTRLLESAKTAETNPLLDYHKRVAQFEERHSN